MTRTPPFHRSTALRRTATASLLLAAAAAAQANVGTTTAPETDGSFADIGYGGTGNIFELIPRLFVQGLGNAGNPQTVATLNPALQYGFSVSGDGSHRLTIDYTLRNTSAVESFSQLRFMLFANPDGGSDFMDRVGETWGPAADGEPVRREARDFDAVNGILTRFALNNNLTEVPGALDAACGAGGVGCDANVALQWNADLLGPNQMLRVQVALSDDGQTLSNRFLTITSASDPGTVLTFSGVSSVSAVPEPGTTALLLAGLLAVGGLARRSGRPAD